MQRAVVLASNGPPDAGPLRYARRDAGEIARILSSPPCSFAVHTPEPGALSDAARMLLLTVAEQCTYDDTLLCYFSGHGFVNRGQLFLLWDDTKIDKLLSTSLSLADVLQALRFSRASNKLLILDCCHAGTVVNMMGMKSAARQAIADLEVAPDNFLILMASDRLEEAREIERLGGSFLTWGICTGLDRHFFEADFDCDGRISIDDMKTWLEVRATTYNSSQKEEGTVPIPYVFGQARGTFYFTVQVPEWRRHEIEVSDGSALVVLPWVERRWWFEGDDLHLTAIGKYPITNAQYRRFVEATGWEEPVGERFDGGWVNTFHPWDDEYFGNPDGPVVCVSFEDAREYAKWARTNERAGLAADASAKSLKLRLPLASEWHVAAYGRGAPMRRRLDSPYWGVRGWRIADPSPQTAVHHRASCTAPIARDGTRDNGLGISDLFGNVWEWCVYERELEPSLSSGREAPEIRGGSFMDDIGEVNLALNSRQLEKGGETRHWDLGFRLAASVPVYDLPAGVGDVVRDMVERGEPYHLSGHRYLPYW